jgi:predicted RNase H-like HicB family nuclease
MTLPKELKSLIAFYTYRIEWSDEDKLYVVSIDELPGCMTDGKTHQEALKNAQDAVETHLMGFVEDKQEVPLPFSKQKFKGDFIVRGTPDLHAKLFRESRRQGYSTLNKFVVDTLKKSVG